MVSLNYLGVSPSLETSSKKGLLVLDTNNCEDLIGKFDNTRDKTSTLISSGWTDSSGGFVGSNNLVAQSNPTGSQKTLQQLLSYTNSTAPTLDPCIQYSTITSELGKYVSTASIGAKSGVAGLDSNKKVPVAQLPSMGSGYLLGPYGPNSVSPGSATTIGSANGPHKLAEWAIQNNGGSNFQPMVYMIVNAETDFLLGRPVIEVRITNGPPTSYSSTHSLVAIGTGRNYYTGNQSIAVLPTASIPGQFGNSSYSANYNTYLTAWLYDAGTGTSKVLSAGAVSVATAFLMRSD
jgi:hypothetical protein